MPKVRKIHYNTGMEDIKRAIEFHKKSDYKNAEIYYLKFLAKHPNEGKAHHLLGGLYMQMKDFKKALEPLSAAYSLEKSIPVETDLGLCKFDLKDFEGAYGHFKNILAAYELNGASVIYEKILECTKNLNLPHEHLKYLIESLQFGEDVYKLREIAALAQDLNEFETAETFLLKLIALYPNDYVAYNNLGLLYEFNFDFKRAENAYKKAVEIKPNQTALYNLFVVLKRQKKYDEALNLLDIAKENNIDLETFKFAKSTLYLAQRNFKEGYKDYVEFLKQKQTGQINLWWDGKTTHKDGVLAICATEGFGDILMFSRYLDFVKTDDFKEVVLIVPSEMLDLYKFNFPNFKVVKMGEDVLYNFATVLVELPLIYNLDFLHIPSSEKYLMVPPEYSEKWKGEFGSKQGLKVGVFFSGNITNKRVLGNRNVPFELLAPILEVNNAKFYSLQPEKSFLKTFEGQNIVNLSSKIGNFSDTAAIIEALDLVITIDSSVAHLAGALGKKTYLMLPYSTDWRWFDDNKATPWYSSVQIFRQQTEGDWAPVIDGIQQEILKSLKN